MPTSSNPRSRIFYTYALLDTRRPGYFRYGHWVFYFEPFYIGKGKGTRWKNHLTYTPYWQGDGPKGRLIRSIQRSGNYVAVRMLKKNVTEGEAFGTEYRAIEAIGRLDRKTGPLTNKNSGGAGSVGRVVSKQTRELLSKKIKAALRARSSEEIKAATAKRKATIEAKDKKAHNLTSQRMSESARNRKKPSFEAMAAIIAKRVATMMAKTPEEKAAKAAKFSASMAARSRSDKKASAKLRSDSLRNLSPEEKAQKAARFSATYAGKSDAEKLAFAIKMGNISKTMHALMSATQKKERGKLISIGKRKRV